MPKRPDTTETTLVALELLRRIPRTRKITSKELQQQLQDAGIVRDLRTIQRQLEMLSRQFEIECDTLSKPYGYRWLEQARALAVPTLTHQESLMLQLAQEHLKNLLPPRLMRGMEGFFTQARRNLSIDPKSALEKQWLSKVRVVATTQPLLPPKIAQGVFETVSEALYSNRWLALQYKNAQGRSRAIEVMPLGLVQQGHSLYLVCRYGGFENERNLALHRILEASVTAQTFVRPKDFNLKTYDDEGRFGFGHGQRIRLRMCITQNAGQHLLESPLSQDQTVKFFKNGALEITATVVQSALLERWLRGFGDEVWWIRRTPIKEPSTPTSGALNGKGPARS